MTSPNASINSPPSPLFRLAVATGENIKWHAYFEKENSSQALCLSAFGSLRSKEFDKIRNVLVANFAFQAFPSLKTKARPRKWDVQVEYEDPSLLSEYGSNQPTSIDVLLTSSQEVIAIEAKFDRDAKDGFGGCNQYKSGKCAGFYGPGSDLAKETPAWCRLENWEGSRSPRTYWSMAKNFFEPSTFEKQSYDDVCPFRGHHYQLMRNFLFAAAFAQKHGKDFSGVITVCPKDNASLLEEQLAGFRMMLLPPYRDLIKCLYYEDWIAILNANQDSMELGDFLNEQIKRVLK